MVEALQVLLTRVRDSLIRDALHNLTAKQREELQSEEFQPVSVGTREELLEWFKTTGRFRQTYEEASRYLCAPLTDEGLREVMHDFSGELYQDIVYGFLSTKQPQSGVLLSPERTFEFYKKLYPSRDVVKHRFRLDSLEGISVPDGIVVEEHDGVEHIVAVCEYTLARSKQIFGNKYEGLDIERRHFSQLFADAYLLFVVPEGANLPRIDAEVQSMPFTHKQFRDYINDIYSCYQEFEGAATLSSIQKNIRKQQRH